MPTRAESGILCLKYVLGLLLACGMIVHKNYQYRKCCAFNWTIIRRDKLARHYLYRRR